MNLVRPYEEKISKKNSKCNSTFTGNTVSFKAQGVNKINLPLENSKNISNHHNSNKNIQLGDFWTNIEKRIKVFKSRLSPSHSNKSANSNNSNKSRSGSVKIFLN
jgi:hypothetical protein